MARRHMYWFFWSKESEAKYDARLRRTALAIPEAVIRRGAASVKRRAQAIYEAKGGNIPRDWANRKRSYGSGVEQRSVLDTMRHGRPSLRLLDTIQNILSKCHGQVARVPRFVWTRATQALYAGKAVTTRYGHLLTEGESFFQYERDCRMFEKKLPAPQVSQLPWVAMWCIPRRVVRSDEQCRSQRMPSCTLQLPWQSANTLYETAYLVFLYHSTHRTWLTYRIIPYASYVMLPLANTSYDNASWQSTAYCSIALHKSHGRDMTYHSTSQHNIT